jgi:phosphate transport system permease protein
MASGSAADAPRPVAWLTDARPRLSDRIGEPGLRALCALAGLAAVAVIVWIAATIFNQASPALSQYGLGFVTSQVWNPNAHGGVGDFGALDFIYGTVISSLVALTIATPTAIAIALYLTELAPRMVRRPVAILVELLAAIPSVILGLWGALVLGPFLANHLEPFLKGLLGWLPLFAGTTSPFGMLNAALILTIMILPIITAVAREVFAQTPAELKEAAYGLGSTRWEMVRMVMLPVGRPGLVGAVILGLGRALGEAIAVTLVIGNATQISAWLFAPAATLAAQIANEFQSANPGLAQGSLMYLAAILLVISLVVNGIARLYVRRAGA